jgi:hypothetical protein
MATGHEMKIPGGHPSVIDMNMNSTHGPLGQGLLLHMLLAMDNDGPSVAHHRRCPSPVLSREAGEGG